MNSFLQVLFAICLVIVLFVIGFAIYNYEFLKSLKTTGVVKEKTEIFRGIKDFSTTKNEVYTTIDKSAPSYRNIGPSINQKGGVEFTYTFWLFNNTGSIYTDPLSTNTKKTPDEGFTEDNVKNQTILFLKGSDDLTTYKNICGEDKKDYYIKCPLVKLEQNGSHLTVEFNTIPSKQGDPVEGVRQGSRNVCTDNTTNWKQANAHKLTLGNINRSEFANKWILVSLVLQDTYPTDPLPYRNKVRCRMYVNNLLELDTYVDGSIVPSRGEYSTIKVNQGNLFVAPQVALATNSSKLPSATQGKRLMMADLTYYNYAVDQATVDSIFAAGPSSKNAPAQGAEVDYSNVLVVANASSQKMTS